MNVTGVQTCALPICHTSTFRRLQDFQRSEGLVRRSCASVPFGPARRPSNTLQTVGDCVLQAGNRRPQSPRWNTWYGCSAEIQVRYHLGSSLLRRAKARSFRNSFLLAARVTTPSDVTSVDAT